MDEKETTFEEYVRQQAERIAFQSIKDPGSLSPEILQETFHELQVHQIELELQNEELRRLQVELEESQARYFGLYDLAPVGYVTLNKIGMILEANLTLCSLLGETRKALEKRPLTHFILPADQDIFYKHKRQIIKTGDSQAFDLRLKHKNGRAIWTQLKMTLHLSLNDEPIYRTTISDISTNKQAEKALKDSHFSLEKTLAELQQTQSQLIKQERLAAVGQMAAGIAHDFNNILTIITLYTDKCLQNTDQPQTLNSNLTTIANQTDLAAKLVQQIIDFGRQTKLQLRLMDLTPFLSEQVKSWQDILSSSIEINLGGETNSYVINADKMRIQQVFTNLFLNAWDTMPHGGILHIGLSHLHLERPQLAPLFTLAAGDWVQITIRDTGLGIPQEILTHIFEPFFTTKQQEKGSGLGLAQVFGIIKQHEGYIDVQSEEGMGTTFTIYLPLHNSESLPA